MDLVLTAVERESLDLFSACTIMTMKFRVMKKCFVIYDRPVGPSYTGKIILSMKLLWVSPGR